MHPSSAAGPDDALVQALRARAHAPGTGRITAMEHRGKRYWIKRVERLSLRWRLQKGNPAARFFNERETLRALSARGAPVPTVVAEGREWFAMPDCGASLEAILLTPGHPARPGAFGKAGAALAQFHALGIRHGRPQPRDLCWDGDKIRFIDFERGRIRPACRGARALDIVQLVHALYALDLRDSPEVDAFCAAYRRHDPDALWQQAEKLCRRLRWIDALTRPIQRREARKPRPSRLREWEAIPLTLRRFGALPSN